MLGPERELPKDLGRQPPIDPLALEPGMIVWDRFVVVGKVRHAAPVWSVLVSDLRREYGRVPHHRVTLHFLPTSERERVSRAIAADEQVQPHVYATVASSKGLSLVHAPIEGEPLPARLPAHEARALALALAGLLMRLHDAQICGLELRSTQLRQREGQFRLDGFEHLLATGTTPEHDVAAMLSLLQRLAGEHLHELLEPPPTRAFELWTRARALVETHDRVGLTLPALPPFVGRERAARVLRQAFGEAEIARASLVLISGEPGVGKSRLLDEFAAELQHGDRALLVRGTYLRGRSESGLRAALAGVARALPSDPDAPTPTRIRERVLKRTGPLAGLLLAYVPAMQALIDPHAELPEIDEAASKSGARALDGGLSRRVVTVADGIRSIGSHERPLVILLDEVQLADHGSLAILRRLLHEDRSHHTLIVAALSGEPPAELRDEIREPPLRKLVLEPLDEPELERLIVEGLPGAVAQPRELAEALHVASRGNPLVAWALLQAWIDRGALTRQDEQGPWLLRQRELPASSPGEVFARRVDAAGLDEQALALLAAVAGDRVDAAWFERVSGWDAARVAGTLAQLERHALLCTCASGDGDERGELRFAHEGIRELVLERAGAGELRRAHAAIAAGLATQPDASAALLAYHTDRALGQESKGRTDLAQMHLAAARELLDVHDLDRSIWHFTRARTEPGDPAGRLAAIEGAADVAILAGRCSEAAELYVEAIEQAKQPALVCRIAAKAVHALLRKSAASEAEAIGRLALSLVDAPLPSGSLRRSLVRLVGERRGPLHDAATREQLGWLYARMASLLGLRDPAEAELCIDRGLAVCEGLESPASAHVLALHAARLAARGQLDAARQCMTRAATLADRSESEWARGVVAHLRACTIELPAGEYEAGLASLDAAIAHFRQTGDMSVAAASCLVKAIHGREREPVMRVQGWLDEGAALGESQGDANVDLAIEALRLYLRARSGARNVVDAALGLQARALARPRFHFEGLLTFAFLALALAEVAEPTRAREQLEVVPDTLPARGSMPELIGDLDLARGLIGSRKDRAARTRVEAATKRLELAGRRAPRLAAFALQIRMRHAMAENQRERAHELATKLLTSAAEHGQLLIVHEAHRTLAELLRSSDVLAAREHQQQAKQIAHQLGLDRARERALMDSSSDDQDAPRPRRREQSTRRRSDAYLRAVARNEVVDASALLEGSRKRLLDMLANASWLYIQAEPELRIYGELHELQSLLVHLALAARDAVPEPAQLRVVATRDLIDERQAVTLPGATPGSWARLAVTIVGVRSGNAGPAGGVHAARQFASRLGGFLVQTQDELNMTLAVYLPAEPPRGSPASDTPPRARTRVLVVHGDAVVRETLGAAITRLGHACTVASPGESIACEFDILFAEREILAAHAEDERVKLVEIAGRISQTSGTFPLLRVPFVLAELRRHLE